MDDVRGLLEEIKANQTTILSRLDKIENTQADTKVHHADLATDLGQVKQVTEDLGLKMQSLRFPKLSPAGSRLVNTTELLEQILWHLGQTHDDSGVLDLLFASASSSKPSSTVRRNFSAHCTSSPKNLTCRCSTSTRFWPIVAPSRI